MSRFNHFLNPKNHNPNWLSLLRIGVAFTLILKIIAEFNAAYLIYGSQGIVQGVINEKIFTPYTLTLHHVADLFSSFIAENTFINIFFVVYLILASLLLIGWQTRIMALGCWLFHVCLFNNSPMVSYGVDSFLLSLLFYCVVFPTHLTYSVDYLQKMQRYDVKTLRYYQILLQLHLCIVYVVAGVAKLKGVTWLNGEAVWYAINQPQFYSYFTTTLVDFAAKYPIIIYVLTWGTLVAEIGYGLFIWIKKIRVFFFISIILMHLFIGLIMNLQLFALMMIVFNLAAFGTQVYADVKVWILLLKKRSKKNNIIVAVNG
ncbi:MAG: HTTM domain-containing protein [Saprospiraceae bacterium]